MKTTKPRPVSMLIPRSGTFGPTDLPPKAAEAPEPNRPQAQDGKSSFEVKSRPKLNRIKTPDFSLPPDDKTLGIFNRGQFADTPKIRSKIFNLGQPLFTEGHERLISTLRDECARLHGYAQHLKAKHVNALDRAHDAESEVQDLRAQAASLKSQNAHLTAEHLSLSLQLETTREALAEVDAMFLDVRMRRLSRIAEVPEATFRDKGKAKESDAVSLGEPIERPKSPTPDSRSVL